MQYQLCYACGSKQQTVRNTNAKKNLKLFIKKNP